MKHILFIVSLCALFQFSVFDVYADTNNSRQLEDKTYIIRGNIKKLPNSERNGTEILIKHDDIPDYTTPDGRVIGMKSMTMPFYFDRSVSLDGLTVGDRVEFKVVQKFTPKFTESLVEIKKITE